jgi:hypothetical protein
VAAQLRALQDLLGDREKSEFLKAAHAYPTASFPWNEENMLGLLLRKRLEPEVVTWVQTGGSKGVALATPADTGTNVEGAKDSEGGMASSDWDELWDWAGPSANEIVRDVFVSDGDSEEEDDDDEDEQRIQLEEQNARDVVSLSLESILRYANIAELRIQGVTS